MSSLKTLTINSALQLGIKSIQGLPAHIKDQTRHAKNVEQFFRTQGLTKWQQVQLRHVLGLVDHMKKQEYAPNTIRLALNTIKVTSNHLSDHHGVPKLAIEQRHIPARKEPSKLWLSFEQLSQACEVARDTRGRQKNNLSQPRELRVPRMMFLLCGVCALRITEFARIIPEDLMNKEQALIVGSRESKSEGSRRIIPLPVFVYEELRDYLECPGLWKGERPWSVDRTALGKCARHALKWAHALTGDESFNMIAPMDLRKTLTNELDGEVSDLCLMAYYGHSVRGTMARHYKSLRAKPGDPEAIRKRAIDHLRNTVVAAIEKKCEKLHF